MMEIEHAHIPRSSRKLAYNRSAISRPEVLRRVLAIDPGCRNSGVCFMQQVRGAGNVIVDLYDSRHTLGLKRTIRVTEQTVRELMTGVIARLPLIKDVGRESIMVVIEFPAEKSYQGRNVKPIITNARLAAEIALWLQPDPRVIGIELQDAFDWNRTGVKNARQKGDKEKALQFGYLFPDYEGRTNPDMRDAALLADYWLNTNRLAYLDK